MFAERTGVAQKVGLVANNVIVFGCVQAAWIIDRFWKNMKNYAENWIDVLNFNKNDLN
jgi:hypothetical protein